MSRSYTKIPRWRFGKSDKKDRSFANRRLRRAVHQGKYEVQLREVSDTWDFSSDGLTHFWRPNGEGMYWHSFDKRLPYPPAEAFRK